VVGLGIDEDAIQVAGHGDGVVAGIHAVFGSGDGDRDGGLVFGAEGVGDLVHDGVGAAVTRGVCGVQVKAYLTVLDGGRTAADADDAGDGKGIALRVYVVGLGID